METPAVRVEWAAHPRTYTRSIADTAEALRCLTPGRARLLELIAAEMLRESEEAQA
jgi:hypothetical protein